MMVEYRTVVHSIPSFLIYMFSNLLVVFCRCYPACTSANPPMAFPLPSSSPSLDHNSSHHSIVSRIHTHVSWSGVCVANAKSLSFTLPSFLRSCSHPTAPKTLLLVSLFWTLPASSNVAGGAGSLYSCYACLAEQAPSTGSEATEHRQEVYHEGSCPVLPSLKQHAYHTTTR